jgi:cytoskeleton protein RodZ
MCGIDEQGDEFGSQLTLSLPRGIHTMRAEEAPEVNQHPATPDTTDPDVSMDLRNRVESPLGQRLAVERERLGWTRADVASRLKLPVKLVERLEYDDYDGLSDGVFLRGYLASYSRLVGLPVEQATRVAAAHTRTAPLVATGTISRTRYLFERYSVSATYLALTAIIVVPAVWLATHGGLEQSLVRTTPLDPPAHVGAVATTTTPLPLESSGTSAQNSDALAAETTTQESSAPASHDQAPVVASMAPFPASTATEISPEQVAPAAASAGGVHLIKLKLAQQSWVEITAGDGRKLEYGMLAAGSEHVYRSDGPLSVRIGNAQGAEVSVDGAAFDLTPYQRANVAHLKLLADGTGARPGHVEQ